MNVKGLTFGLFLSCIWGLHENDNVYAKTYLVRMRSPNAFRQLVIDWKASLRQTPQRDIFGAERARTTSTLHTRAHTLNVFEQLRSALIEGDEQAAHELARNTDVEYIEEDILYPRPDAIRTASSAGSTRVHTDPSLATTSFPMPWGVTSIQAPEAWKLGAKGSHVRVLVLDTGIDRDHPALRGRFEAGKNFVAPSRSSRRALPLAGAGLQIFRPLEGGFEEDFDSPLEEDLDNPPAPYDYFDHEGHGTHVAGTIAGSLNGQDTIGIAPLAKILMGRVCGLRSCATSAIVNGLNWAIQQKVDVVNMSIGGAGASRATAEALADLEQQGIVAVAASGNSGEPNLAYPSAYPTVVSVGSVDENGARHESSQYGPTLSLVAPGIDIVSSIPIGSARHTEVLATKGTLNLPLMSASFPGSPASASPIEQEVVFARYGRPQDFDTVDIHGKIALIERSPLPIHRQVALAYGAGAVGVALYGDYTLYTEDLPRYHGYSFQLPVVAISRSAAEALKIWGMQNEHPRLSISIQSRDYARYSGTSMAAPHVTGVVALIKSVNRNLSPEQIRYILKDTTNPPPENVQHNEYGAGYVNAEQAIRRALQPESI